jgi:23S rRNA (adenine2030-N6)-methyltransferase
LNYRHAFHAGNFADVLKHIVLVRVLMHLRRKDTAFRVIETHAGAGRYDLAGGAAGRTGEWRLGVGRLLAEPVAGEADALIEPYLALIRAESTGTEPTHYPGSPALALALTRPQDRLLFYELHPDEHAALAAVIGRDRRVKLIEADGWTALKAAVPPPERRGLVLVDPPFEQPDEFQRLVEGLGQAYRRWATGIFVLWYPIKDQRESRTFVRRILELGIEKILQIELMVAQPSPDGALVACGMLVINPPWTLQDELKAILPALARTLGRGQPAHFHVDWLVP